MIPTRNGDSIHSWFYPSKYSSNFSINPIIAEGQAKTAFINLQQFVKRLEDSGHNYRYESMPRDTFYALAGYCEDLGEQVSKLVSFDRSKPYTFNDTALTTCYEVLRDLRNRIAHELSVGIRPKDLFLTALEIVEEPYYADSINTILYEIHSSRPQMYNLGSKHVNRKTGKGSVFQFSRLF